MTVDSLDGLLSQLNGGDPAAAERVFLTYEPYLRKVVRRLLPDHLRPKFDSIDVVQSVWGDVFAAFRDGGMKFSSVAQLRAFLVQSTRNRFIDRVRENETPARRERSVATETLDELTAALTPLPGAEMEADEMWEQLNRLCPPEHREVLRLSRQGLSAVEVAERTGLHAGSVRRILRDLSLKLACRETPR